MVWTTCLTKPKSIAALKLGVGAACSAVAGSAAAAAAAIHLRPWHRKSGLKFPRFRLIADLIASWGGFNSKLLGQGTICCSEVYSCLRQQPNRERCKRKRAKAGPELLQVRQAIKLTLLGYATAERELQFSFEPGICRTLIQPSRAHQLQMSLA